MSEDTAAADLASSSNSTTSGCALGTTGEDLHDPHRHRCSLAMVENLLLDPQLKCYPDFVHCEGWNLAHDRMVPVLIVQTTL
jgi:hypothetical protein